MIRDRIVEEVRAARQAHAARFAYDLHAIVQDARRHQKTSRKRIVTLRRRRHASQP